MSNSALIIGENASLLTIWIAVIELSLGQSGGGETFGFTLRQQRKHMRSLACTFTRGCDILHTYDTCTPIDEQFAGLLNGGSSDLSEFRRIADMLPTSQCL